MSYQKHKLAALMQLDPVAARVQIVAALESSGMHMEAAAQALGCAHNTMLRWIERLEIDVDALRERARDEGWHHDRHGGRPLGSTVAAGAAPRRSKVAAR